MCPGIDRNISRENKVFDHEDTDDCVDESRSAIEQASVKDNQVSR